MKELFNNPVVKVCAVLTIGAIFIWFWYDIITIPKERNHKYDSIFIYPKQQQSALDSVIYKSLIDSPQNWHIIHDCTFGTMLENNSFDTIPNFGRRNYIKIDTNGLCMDKKYDFQLDSLIINIVRIRINNNDNYQKEQEEAKRQRHIDYLIHKL